MSSVPASKDALVLAINNSFLKLMVEKGNDLSTPRPEYGFPGLKVNTESY